MSLRRKSVLVMKGRWDKNYPWETKKRLRMISAAAWLAQRNSSNGCRKEEAITKKLDMMVKMARVIEWRDENAKLGI